MNKKDKLIYLSKIASGKIAKFLPDIQALILKRDKTCIICKSKNKIKAITDFHHALYGSHRAEYNKEYRNNPEKGVGLCSECHHEIHHGIKGLSKEYELFCIDYINKLKNEKT